MQIVINSDGKGVQQLAGDVVISHVTYPILSAAIFALTRVLDEATDKDTLIIVAGGRFGLNKIAYSLWKARNGRPPYLRVYYKIGHRMCKARSNRRLEQLLGTKNAATPA
jgi:hypothetical protein